MEAEQMELVDEGGVPATVIDGGGDESDDELTIDDSCVVNECGEEPEEDDNVELVSSTTLHQMNEDEEMKEVPDKETSTMNADESKNDDAPNDNATAIKNDTSSPPQTLKDEAHSPEKKEESAPLKNEESVPGKKEEDVEPPEKMEEESTPKSPEEEAKASSTPASPQGPESPSIQSPDPHKSPAVMASSPPGSPDNNSTPIQSQTGSGENSQVEAITSQENFSSMNTTAVSMSTITSQSSVPVTPAVSADTTLTTDNEESQSSQPPKSPTPPPKEATKESSSKSNGSRSRSKSRSRSNTVEEEDDVDLEDGEIMDDEEEEPPPSKTAAKKEKEKDKKPSSSSSSSTSSKDKEKERREKEKEKEREKEKHRKDKKRSKREEEKEKEKKNKKRKASDAESEQEEYMLVRGASPGSQDKSQQDPNPWIAPVEEFGDDSKVSRAKRRRESDGDNSPHHHHHGSTRPPREASPPRRPPPTAEPPRGKPSRPMRGDDRKDPKSDVICAYFMQGKCQKSASECSFSHDAVPPRKMELCKFWMMECCAKKEKCLYLHNDFPCKYFHTGLICKAAERCKFSHKPLSEGTKQVLLKHIETAPKEILGDFPRLNRQGAINLINKMEARMRGEVVEDDGDRYGEMAHNDHHGRGPPIPPPHERHHGGRSNDDRHRRDHHGNHHHHGPPGNHNMPPHEHLRGPPPGRGDMRGPPRDDRHPGNNRGNNNQPSRWEQHPTRDDQEKLQELMEEAGISGFYKETMENNAPNQPPPGLPPLNQPPPGMQPPLLPLNPLLMMPGLIPNTSANSIPNPAAFANVLASLNMPTPPTTLAGLPLNVPPPSIVSSHNDDSNDSLTKAVPDHLPKMQQELFMRVQKSQAKVAEKKKDSKSPPPQEPEENWYSSEDEDDPPKKKKAEDAVADKISSMLSQIRQQQQQTNSAATAKIPPLSSVDTNKPFYGDTDFRSQPPPSSFKDVDLRNPVPMFKKIDIEPAREINASLSHNGPFPWRFRKVKKPRIDYSQIRLGLPQSTVVLDPRLNRSKRGGGGNDSIPAPASPTETTGPDVGLTPLTIPDGTPVFDPRMRGAPPPPLGGRGLTPQQNNPFLDSDNRFVSLPNSGVNDFGMFNRDPRGGHGPGGPPPGANQQMAMAAALAAMQQGIPPTGIDPSMLLMGFPFMPPNNQQGGVGGGGGGPMDFQQLMAAGGGMRMRPPFPPPQGHHHHHHGGGSSGWEKYSQGGGGGDLTPPL